jgi:hypothetical protein
VFIVLPCDLYGFYGAGSDIELSENQVIRNTDYIAVLQYSEHELENPSEPSPQGANGDLTGCPKGRRDDPAGIGEPAETASELR